MSQARSQVAAKMDSCSSHVGREESINRQVTDDIDKAGNKVTAKATTAFVTSDGKPCMQCLNFKSLERWATGGMLKVQ